MIDITCIFYVNHSAMHLNNDIYQRLHSSIKNYKLLL